MIGGGKRCGDNLDPFELSGEELTKSNFIELRRDLMRKLQLEQG